MWSSILWTVVRICEVWPWIKTLVGSGGISLKSFVILVLVSSLEILASSPLFWSMIWSSFFVKVLSKRGFFSFVFYSFQFFVPYLLAAPTRSVSVFVAVVAKSYCILSSFLVWIYCSRISFYSINSVFLESRSELLHLLAQGGHLSLGLFFAVQKVGRNLKWYIFLYSSGRKVVPGGAGIFH